MLLITRRVGEKIMVGDDVVVHVMEIVGNTVRVGIQAPRSRAGLPRGDLARRPRREPRRGRRRAVRASVARQRSLAKRVSAGPHGPRRVPGYGLGMDFAKTARNLAVADIALAFARDRVARMVPGVRAAQAGARRCQDPADRRRHRRRRSPRCCSSATPSAACCPAATPRPPAPSRPTRRRRSPTTTPPVRLRTPRPPCPSRPPSRSRRSTRPPRRPPPRPRPPTSAARLRLRRPPRARSPTEAERAAGRGRRGRVRGPGAGRGRAARGRRADDGMSPRRPRSRTRSSRPPTRRGRDRRAGQAAPTATSGKPGPGRSVEP